VKLKHLPAWNEARRRNAKLYNEILGNTDGVVSPLESPHSRHVYHIYAIRVQNRDALIKALAEKDIHCGIHYPISLHLQEAYRGLGYKRGSFPVSETVQAEFVSLPMFPELTNSQIQFAAENLVGFVTGSGPVLPVRS
jgi:dTDP-4-amino-4,6-dideoxygalactose transaminase